MTETMTIAAKGSLILSAAAIGVEKDRQLSAGEKATVPYAYGLHLVSDKFAIEVKAKRKATKAEIKTAIAACRAADAKVREAGDDLAARAAAEQELAAAEAALADLQD